MSSIGRHVLYQVFRYCILETSKRSALAIVCLNYTFVHSATRRQRLRKLEFTLSAFLNFPFAHSTAAHTIRLPL
ncbi:MAG: hypothetical protein FWC41_10150, partial [Firmicutes bacterium]|nr:hypothetical protein [Bacillota bacterium]